VVLFLLLSLFGSNFSPTSYPTSRNISYHITATCDALTVFTDSSVSNFSDHLSSLEGGKKTYDHASNCSWLIQPAGAAVIRLRFSAFDLETGWDFLYVYDGPTVDSKKKLSLTGTTIPPEFVSSGPSILLVFVTDTGVASTGFTASYTASM
jgi:hypothetical protein